MAGSQTTDAMPVNTIVVMIMITMMAMAMAMAMCRYGSGQNRHQRDPGNIEAHA